VRLEIESATKAKPKLQRAFATLEQEGRRQMRAEGFSGNDVENHRSLDMRYAGQSYELNVPFTGNFISAFHRAHEKRHGYFDRSRACEAVNIRARFTGHTPKPTLPKLSPGGPNPAAALVSESPAIFHGLRKLTPIYDRAKLRAGNRILGPAIVTEYSATTLITPEWSARVDRNGNLILEPRR
jgi:N-methylhydantoinase A